MDPHPLKNNIVRSLFRMTIIVKGVNGVWEVAVGVSLFFFKQQDIHSALMFAARHSVIQISGYNSAHYIVKQANNFSVSIQYFIAWYFLFYGLVNIFLVVFLLKDKWWAYPGAIVFFTLFILYQCYRFFLHQSGLLLFFTLFDMLLVFLTWLEYQRVKKNLPSMQK